MHNHLQTLLSEFFGCLITVVVLWLIFLLL
jgi:hypothetical protein